MRDLETLIAPVVTSDGLELVETLVTRENGERVLRVTVDRPDGALDLETIAKTSERISRRLDLEGFDPGPGSYRLEVSSPGIERALKSPDHFRRRVGDRVKVKTTEPIDGSWTHVGALVSADAEAIVVVTDGAEVRLGYDDIASARTVFEWGAAQKRGTK